MNIILELPDDLGREARDRAVGASKSLPDWITDLVAREASPSPVPVPTTLLEALGDESLAEADLPLPERRPGQKTPVQFP